MLKGAKITKDTEEEVIISWELDRYCEDFDWLLGRRVKHGNKFYKIAWIDYIRQSLEPPCNRGKLLSITLKKPSAWKKGSKE